MPHKILNMRLLKLTVALAVPSIIAGGFFYAQNMATQEIRRYEVEQERNPSHEAVTVRNYELKEVDDSNQLRWQLVAASGVMVEDQHAVQLSDVRIYYFDAGQVKLTMRAPSGLADEERQFIRLSGAGRQRVIASGEDGKQLEAEVVELTKKNQFAASGGVNIDLPTVAKVTGQTATGIIDGTQIAEFKVVGNTHARIVVQETSSEIL